MNCSFRCPVTLGMIWWSFTGLIPLDWHKQLNSRELKGGPLSDTISLGSQNVLKISFNFEIVSLAFVPYCISLTSNHFDLLSTRTCMLSNMEEIYVISIKVTGSRRPRKQTTMITESLCLLTNITRSNKLFYVEFRFGHQQYDLINIFVRTTPKCCSWNSFNTLCCNDSGTTTLFPTRRQFCSTDNLWLFLK